ncbi:RusA family crossover junction endodeoxyribonuclease [Stenotrophomonas maltophilia]|uniref:RusA family crossover junction endodeoxyribonuclease n=1 Tax=Stenotrophomonas maltophilia TaxID=40324 RepID=UPI001310661E|nr:RusA family crossover junction endodeoxyribonuclease [Stenotrophomonas maltophilia]
MVKVKLATSNCDASNISKIEELSTAEVRLIFELDRIVSVQSQKAVREELCAAIRGQLQDFNWICAGHVNLELLWYLHETERQETDKIGDMDNITKPIIDALTGQDGLIIDDSQVGSLHSFWSSRNHQTEKDILHIRVEFSNDECLRKDDLIFIQYSAAMCMPFNVDFNRVHDIIGALAVIKARRMQRRLAAHIRQQGHNFDRGLVSSSWDFHRTRLGGMRAGSIYRLEEFLAKSKEHGLTWSSVLNAFRSFNRVRPAAQRVSRTARAD